MKGAYKVPPLRCWPCGTKFGQKGKAGKEEGSDIPWLHDQQYNKVWVDMDVQEVAERHAFLYKNGEPVAPCRFCGIPHDEAGRRAKTDMLLNVTTTG